MVLKKESKRHVPFRDVLDSFLILQKVTIEDPKWKMKRENCVRYIEINRKLYIHKTEMAAYVPNLIVRHVGLDVFLKNRTNIKITHDYR